MSELRFEDPPGGPGRRPVGGTGIHWTAATNLRERPGEWAHIRTCNTRGTASSMARQIRIGSMSVYAPRGSFEAVSRTVDGEFRIYARYVGHLEGPTS